MKIFLDFDDVLFNTKRFVADYKKIFFQHGISEEFFSTSYYQDYPKKSRKHLKKYDPQAHIKAIEKKFGRKFPMLKEDVKKISIKSEQYIFPDSFDFLKRFSKEKLYLVSYGNTRFQKNKIDHLGIGSFFQKIVITDKMKSVEIAKMMEKKKKDEKLYFIDDRIEQVDAVKKNNPGIITFLMRRKDGRYRDKKTKYVDHAVTDFKKVVKVIKNYGI